MSDWKHITTGSTATTSSNIPTTDDNLALLRTSHEYTQQQLTDAMNEMGTFIHRAAYANIERGKRNLKVTDLVCLKTIYNVPYEAFFEGIKIHE